MDNLSIIKLTQKKKIDNDTVLKVMSSKESDRIIVEFSTEDRKIVLQKSFQDTYLGNKEAAVFQESIKSLDDLRAYFNLPKKEKTNVI